MSLPLSWAFSALYAVLLFWLDSLVNCFQCFRRQCLYCPGFSSLFFLTPSFSFSPIFGYSINDWKIDKQQQKKKERFVCDTMWNCQKNCECEIWMILVYMWWIRLVVGWYGSQRYCFNSNWILTHVLHKFSFPIDLNSKYFFCLLLSSYHSAFDFKICID